MTIITPPIPKEYCAKVSWVREYVDEDQLTYKLFRLDTKDLGIAFEAGQFFMVGHDSVKLPTGLPKLSAFSVASSPEQANEFIEFCFAIKPEQNEKPSVGNYVGYHQQIGDDMILKGPFGKFVLPSEWDELVLISSGSGVAPMVAYARHLLLTGCKKPIHFYFGFRNHSRYLYEEELVGYAQQHENFIYTPIMSRPPEDWFGEKGYVQNIAVKNYRRDSNKKVFALLCGNLSMCEEATKLLLENGFSEDEVRKEVY